MRVWHFVSGSLNLIFDQGVGTDPDMVWARRSLTKSIEFAFKPTLTDGDVRFAWWAWAFQGTIDPLSLIPLNTLPANTYLIRLM